MAADGGLCVAAVATLPETVQAVVVHHGKHVFPVRGYGSEHCFAGIGNLRNGEVLERHGRDGGKLRKRR